MSAPSRLSHAEHLAHLVSESARFRTVLADADPAARVPGCPDWSATDLLRHLTGVQRFWAGRVLARPAPPPEGAADDGSDDGADDGADDGVDDGADDGADDGDGAVPRPGSHADLLAAFDEAHASLVGALDGVDPAEEAWTWSPDHTVAFIARRQAHEALIHRLDAEQAAGAVTDLPADLAADGVLEVLDVMYGGSPAWGTFVAGRHLVRVDCTDTDHQVWVRLGTFAGTDPDSGTAYADEPDLRVEPAPDDPDVEPDLVVEGTAAALDAWLWRRGDDAALTVAGDRAVHERLRTILDQPIE